MESTVLQFSGLDDVSRQDLDPEDVPAQSSEEESGSEESEDELAGTEHYVEVGKSKLRKRDEVALGPEYAGARISRGSLLNEEDDEDGGISESDEDLPADDPSHMTFADPEAANLDIDEEDGDIDSDEAFGESDSEKFKDFTFRGSSKPVHLNGKKSRPTAADFMSDSPDEEADGLNGMMTDEDETDEDILDVDEQHKISENGSENESESESRSEEEAEGSEVADSSSIESDEDQDDDEEHRDELRKIMNEEQKAVVATISQAAQADAMKGNAVKQQRKTFDSLLSIRMTLQKALIASNAMSTIVEDVPEAEKEQPYQAAEDAALKLWNTLDSLRQQLNKTSNGVQTGQKRKRDVDSSTASSKIWQRMQASEVASIDGRQRTLEKWWDRFTGSAAPLTGKLNNKVTSVSLTFVIQEQLAKPESLQRTKRPRSCAPIQEKLKLIEDDSIYDDTSLYKTLLNQLVEQRKMDAGPLGVGTAAPAQWAVKEAKMRKNVDTKASKGRKMRFTVHEKLQNFMAPEDRTSWEQDAIDRFFGTLLGQKMTLREEDLETNTENLTLEEEGLRLFRS